MTSIWNCPHCSNSVKLESKSISRPTLVRCSACNESFLIKLKPHIIPAKKLKHPVPPPFIKKLPLPLPAQPRVSWFKKNIIPLLAGTLSLLLLHIGLNLYLKNFSSQKNLGQTAKIETKTNQISFSTKAK